MISNVHVHMDADLEREEWLRKIRSVLRSFGRDVAEPRNNDGQSREDGSRTRGGR